MRKRRYLSTNSSCNSVKKKKVLYTCTLYSDREEGWVGIRMEFYIKQVKASGSHSGIPYKHQKQDRRHRLSGNGTILGEKPPT